ncbi:hypothetical protein B0H15DRAFT_578027 [Mycena belliarum]|uniref:Uncharacterized protein n=1 Tax=Mycena belliarum TaxID=1033014 RepID=A0AAD6TT09_9AGAR|nr:hypothetical protein B0H15DRAFT_578027 [Mycena belliae]
MLLFTIGACSRRFWMRQAHRIRNRWPTANSTPSSASRRSLRSRDSPPPARRPSLRPMTVGRRTSPLFDGVALLARQRSDPSSWLLLSPEDDRSCPRLRSDRPSWSLRARLIGLPSWRCRARVPGASLGCKGDWDESSNHREATKTLLLRRVSVPSCVVLSDMAPLIRSGSIRAIHVRWIHPAASRSAHHASTLSASVPATLEPIAGRHLYVYTRFPTPRTSSHRSCFLPGSGRRGRMSSGACAQTS